jgi:hypothetical protein
MRKIYIITLLSIISIVLHAQVDKDVAKDVSSNADKGSAIKEGWTKGASFNMNFNQTTLSNWFAGGDKLSIGLNTLLKANTTYKKGKGLFKANLEAAYGIINTTTSGGVRKTDDRWVITSSFNQKAAKNLYYTLAGQIKSQFTQGFSYSKEGKRTLISDLLSPGDIKLGLGLTYQPNSKFSAYVSPVTAKINVKNADAFYNQKIFGVDSNQRYAFDLGAFARIDYKTNLKKDLLYTASIDAFYGYILKNYNFYFANLFNWKLNKYFGATFSFDIAYDNTQPTPVYIKDANGNEQVKLGADGKEIKVVKLQIKQFFGLGFNYSF